MTISSARHLVAAIIERAVNDYKLCVSAGLIIRGKLNQRAVGRTHNGQATVKPQLDGYRSPGPVVELCEFFFPGEQCQRALDLGLLDVDLEAIQDALDEYEDEKNQYFTGEIPGHLRRGKNHIKNNCRRSPSNEAQA